MLALIGSSSEVSWLATTRQSRPSCRPTRCVANGSRPAPQAQRGRRQEMAANRSRQTCSA